MARDYSEDIEIKYAEEALERNAKARIQSNNYNCSIKVAKFKLKRETTLKKVRCKKCVEGFSKPIATQGYVLVVKERRTDFLENNRFCIISRLTDK
ncbi:hypothetical protein [Methanobacterium sp. BAmetb5]|uniref:hypothetical protein n=1 Tax=Methanobacterium sp. BAmetb5 TaxID=2025351 RepID=UPI000E9017EC|nr:hypothetical protein [Methanobacterium sp. BAmetb5]AXV40690.1 MAG: hypothetical protein CIT02_10380 [Methanobacterium sp. BAmetb5]